MHAVAVAVPLLALIAGCGGAGAPAAPTAPAAATPPSFVPAPCDLAGVDAAWPAANGVECGWLEVAESRGRADSRVLRLWVAIARATGATTAAPLLYIHGGPGIATVDAQLRKLSMPAWTELRAGRDLVFFDQRGTGRSRPALCPELDDAMNALSVEDPPARVALERQVAALTACRTKLLAEGMDFAGYNSAATAADAEELRRALGHPAWDVYGVSYGTWVALELVRRHPAGVRAVVLDSPYPPNSPFWAEESILPTGKAYEAVERACRADPACAARFPDVRGRLAAAMARLDARPIEREGGRITGNALAGTLWGMLVRGATVRWVPLAIEHAAAGDDAMIRRLVESSGGADSFGRYSYGQALAVNCHESLAGSSERAIRAAMRRYPFLVSHDALPEAMDRLCAAWQPHRAPAATFAPVASDRPVLLLAGELDPATPPEDALQAARLLSRSTIVDVAGASHAPMHTDDCTRGIVRAFLAEPTRPVDTSCLAMRPTFRFATDGLEAFVREREAKAKPTVTPSP